MRGMGRRVRSDPDTLAGSLVDGAEPAMAAPHDPHAGVELLYAGQRFGLASGETIVGRGDESDVAVDSPGVSRRHARITIDGGRVTIEDLGSRNGTFVGDRRIDTKTEICESAAIRIGPVWFMLQRVVERH